MKLLTEAAPPEVGEGGACADMVVQSDTSADFSDLRGDESPPHAAIKRARLAPSPALLRAHRNLFIAATRHAFAR